MFRFKHHKILFFFLILLSICFKCLGSNDLHTTVADKNGNKSLKTLRGTPVRFLENKGQMMDMNNKPVPFVLFKAEAPGVTLYITEKGLTYTFMKMEEE